MTRFWRTVSIALGALLAASCHPRTKYGVDTGDTGDTGGEDVQATAAPLPPQAAPLPAETPTAPAALAPTPGPR
jgi:hypothetical protein